MAVTPRWLESLTFLGVASFILGIALELSSMPMILGNRGQVMGVCFPLIVKLGGEPEDKPLSLRAKEKPCLPFNGEFGNLL